jgi:hypothetical protein
MNATLQRKGAHKAVFSFENKHFQMKYPHCALAVKTTEIPGFRHKTPIKSSLYHADTIIALYRA